MAATRACTVHTIDREEGKNRRRETQHEIPIFGTSVLNDVGRVADGTVID